MKIFCFLIVSCLLINCRNKSKEIPAEIASSKETEIETEIEEIIPVVGFDSLKLGINFKSKGNYNDIKSKIKKDRKSFQEYYLSSPEKAIDSASNYLYNTFLNAIVPHWYNTEWDFNGHTDIPNQGEIACGYFVSTTLKHLGFNLNRYKMAQQGGFNEARTLQKNSDLKFYRNISYDDLKTQLNAAYQDGIYFVGLSNHVGFVLIKDEELYFLHSSYYDDKVMIELAEKSPCFPSNIYVFAEVFSNRKLVRKWIVDEVLVVPSG